MKSNFLLPTPFVSSRYAIHHAKDDADAVISIESQNVYAKHISSPLLMLGGKYTFVARSIFSECRNGLSSPRRTMEILSMVMLYLRYFNTKAVAASVYSLVDSQCLYLKSPILVWTQSLWEVSLLKLLYYDEFLQIFYPNTPSPTLRTLFLIHSENSNISAISRQ